MAIAIKSIPILRKKAASDFIKKVDESTARKSSVDFSKQVSTASKIFAKAKL
ncbi:MAG: hypothetical protein H6584_06525 [Flavobacteriales bacterium]|nr:hypothetical protein [Flavobacteriales bacterium]